MNGYHMGRPRRPPAVARVHTAGLQIRQHEYQSDLTCAQRLQNPSKPRDRELISASGAVISALRDRGFGDIRLPQVSLFRTIGIGISALEVGVENSPVSHRVLIFSDLGEFQVDNSMMPGVRGSHTRPLLPTPETLHTSWRGWQGMFENTIIKPWANWGGDLSRETQTRSVCDAYFNLVGSVPKPSVFRHFYSTLCRSQCRMVGAMEPNQAL